MVPLLLRAEVAAVVEDVGVHRGIILGAAFGNRVTEIVRKSSLVPPDFLETRLATQSDTATLMWARSPRRRAQGGANLIIVPPAVGHDGPEFPGS